MPDPIATIAGLAHLTPEARAAATNAFPAVTLRAARERFEHSTTPAEQKVLKQWVSRYEHVLKTQRDAHLDAGIRNASKRAEESALRTQEHLGRLAEVIAETDNGRRSSKELRQAYAEAERLVREVREQAESADLAFTEREKLRAVDPADHQDSWLNRLPALRDRLPALLGELPQHVRPVQGGPGDAQWTPTKNINTAQSLHGHADKIQKMMDAALDGLERAERRERLVSGSREGGLAERLPALAARS